MWEGERRNSVETKQTGQKQFREIYNDHCELISADCHMVAFCEITNNNRVVSRWLGNKRGNNQSDGELISMNLIGGPENRESCLKIEQEY